MKGYKFLKADMRSGWGDEPPWEIGVKREIPKDRRKQIVICEYGYHASPTLWAALQYAQGPVACLVETGRPVKEKQNDKWVAASLTIIKAVNIDRELRIFAADCAERVLYSYEREYPSDTWQATLDFANGKIGDAARDAVWAARSAARDAASAWAAAWDAVGDVACVIAARDAARAAEIKWQKQHFAEMFGTLFKVGRKRS